MNAAKKSLQKFVDKEQKRVIMVTVGEDGKLQIKGDHISFLNLEEDADTQEALKRILTTIPEESDTSYNFGGHLTYAENSDLEFPKMFAKIDTNNWKGANVAKTLSKYFTLLGFGTNNMKTYGKEEHKPVWWPRKPRWSEFINPSKSSKAECTFIIKQLLEYYGIDPAIHYVNYPDEEFSDSGSEASHSNADPLGDDDTDLNNSFPRQDEEDDEDVNNSFPRPDEADIEEEFRRFEEEQLREQPREKPRKNYVLLSRSAKKRKH